MTNKIEWMNVNVAVIAGSIFINENFPVLLINSVALGVSTIHRRYTAGTD